MENSYLNDLLGDKLENVLERRRSRVKEAAHKRNVAAIVDFASNLISLIGNSKGVHHSFATNNFPRYNALYKSIRAQHKEAMRDFKGAIAGSRLLGGDAASVRKAQKKTPFNGEFQGTGFLWQMNSTKNKK